MSITDQQLHYFRTFGFLKFPALFAPEIDRITEAFEEVWAASGRTHDGVARSMLVPFVDQSEFLSGLLADPRIDDVATAILGPDYSYATSDGNYYVGETKWHSDKEPTDPIASFKIAFYLDPVGPDNGCLRVIPGSIHGGDPFGRALHEAIPFTFSSRPEESWGVAGRDVPAYPIPSVPGDMLLFDHRIKRSSWGGGDRRRMFTYNFSQHYPAELLPRLRDEVAQAEKARTDGGTGAYGETLLRTVGPRIMRHLEQRLSVADGAGETAPPVARM
jgi:hypothetical protein